MSVNVKIFCFIPLLFTCFYGESQTFEAKQQTTDTVSKETTLKSKNPRLAAVLSTIIPGAGQAYNQKYWKLPIIYGGFAALIYFSSSNNKEYVKFREAYEQKMQNGGEAINQPYPGVPAEAIQRERDIWRRYRDLTIIGIGLLYVLNIIDANVDANLFDYDVGGDLSLRVSPKIEYIENITITKPQTPFYGAGVTIKF